MTRWDEVLCWGAPLLLSHKYFQLEPGWWARLTNYVTAHINFVDAKRGTESCVKEFHATFHDVHYIPFGTKGSDAQMRQRVVLGDNMRYPLTFHTSLWDGIDRLKRRFVWRHTMGHPLMVRSILRYGMDSWDWELHWGTPRDIPSCPMVSFGDWRMRWRDGRDTLWWPRLCMCGKTPHHGTNYWKVSLSLDAEQNFVRREGYTVIQLYWQLRQKQKRKLIW